MRRWEERRFLVDPVNGDGGRAVQPRQDIYIWATSGE